jgi:hypothetical protein
MTPTRQRSTKQTLFDMDARVEAWVEDLIGPLARRFAPLLRRWI